MIDAVFALVLILSVVFGAKRGLFRSFMALAAIVLALLGSVVRTLVFVLCFLVLTLLLRLVTGGIDKVLDLPVLNALNTIGGGALGLIEGALLLFLVCDVAPKLGVKAFADYEGTYLLLFFMSHTPRGLVAALLP